MQSKSFSNMTQNIINIFPKIELSYDKIIHKKVLASASFDMILAIPKGPKAFLWITKYNGRCISIFLTLRHDKKIQNVSFHHFNCPFENDLINEKGTLFYGTLFITNNSKCFTIENILLFKGLDMKLKSWGEKMEKIESVFKMNQIQQLVGPKIIVGMPILATQTKEYDTLLEMCNYKIYKTEYRCHHKNTSVSTLADKENKNSQESKIDNNKIFIVKPSLQNDIYELFSIKNNEFVDIAHIPDFKTSVMMNSIFRNIKENNNLDALEESDDEEDFQKENETFVYMDRKAIMKCVYNYKFQKWKPLFVIDN